MMGLHWLADDDGAVGKWKLLHRLERSLCGGRGEGYKRREKNADQSAMPWASLDHTNGSLLAAGTMVQSAPLQPYLDDKSDGRFDGALDYE
jgi:hypothetical protein